MSCRACRKNEPEVILTSCNRCSCAICSKCAIIVYGDGVTVFEKNSTDTRILCPNCYKKCKVRK